MDDELDKGGVAFHLVMALLSDVCLHEPLRAGRMADMLARVLDQMGDEKGTADVRAAYDTMLRLTTSLS